MQVNPVDITEEKFMMEFYLERIKTSKLERESSESRLIVERLRLENFKLQMTAKLKQFEDSIKSLEEEIQVKKNREDKVKEEYKKDVYQKLRKEYKLGEHFSYDPLTGEVIVSDK